MQAVQAIRRYLHQPKAILSAENPFSAPDRAHGPSKSRQRAGTGLVRFGEPAILRWSQHASDQAHYVANERPAWELTQTVQRSGSIAVRHATTSNGAIRN